MIDGENEESGGRFHHNRVIGDYTLNFDARNGGGQGRQARAGARSVGRPTLAIAWLLAAVAVAGRHTARGRTRSGHPRHRDQRQQQGADDHCPVEQLVPPDFPHID